MRAASVPPVAYACLHRGTARSIAIYDVNGAKAEAEVLDLNHGLQFVSPATVVGGDDVAICAGADVVVITAGAKQEPGQTRLDLAEANARLCHHLVPALMRVAPEAILLVVTNPVDVLTGVVLRLSGLPRRRVLGTGTVLDSSRFRFLLAQRCDVAVANVHAYIVGEHGDSEIPLWSSATVGGVPVQEWARPGLGALSVSDREEVVREVKQAAYRVIQGKGATDYAIGLATARILEAILGDERAVLPVSTLQAGENGVDGVCLSMPCVVHRGGVDPPLRLPMDAVEREGLMASAAAIAEVSVCVANAG